MAFKNKFDHSFQDFTKLVNAKIKSNATKLTQQQQVDNLYQNECNFKKCLINSRFGDYVYNQFVTMIENGGNTLKSKSYFREKASICLNMIIPAIKSHNYKKLQQFDINYHFISFTMKVLGDKQIKIQLTKLYNKVIQSRQLLIENNLPLAINRAKLFYRKTSKSQTSGNSITLVDLIDMATAGLARGIDNHCGPYTKVWRSVCIGNMVAWMINEYSDSNTLLKLPQEDRQILYRAKSIMNRVNIANKEELVQIINTSFMEDISNGVKNIPRLPITIYKVSELLNSVGYVSSTTAIHDSNQLNNDDNKDLATIYDRTADDEVDTPEDAIIKKDLIQKIYILIQKLDLVSQKVIKLKGVGV